MTDTADNAPLLESQMAPDPVTQFRQWFDTACAESPVADPTAMVLATATPDGTPSARMVLLKAFDQDGFVFYTNLASRKAAELGGNRPAALLFWWPERARQVRIEGAVAAVGAEEADAYFATRPRGAQIGAWASPQSRVLADRADLEARIEAVRKRFEGQPLPRPAQWGGFRLRPECVEFWQGREDRLHDRLRYLATADDWRLERLAP